ncbi:MAG: tripartite tricarboxylate transporter permease [Candidatus Aenigmatarchaeota archaeon]
MLDFVLISILGILIGLFAGLMPSMHVNTLLPLLLSFSASFNLSPYHLAVLIVSTAMSEIFFNFIPSIFIGAPEEGTALSVLPGHRLLLEGRGYEAIKLTVIGSIGSLILGLVLITFLSPYFYSFYKITRPYIHFAIIGVVAFMIFSERKPKKIISSTFIILLSGIFGLLVLNSQLLPSQHVLFPVLTGMFGLSTLIISFSETSKIPEQKEDFSLKISTKEIFKSIFLGSIAGILVGFLPAVGISEAAVMVQYLGGRGDARSFLVTLSGINVGNEVFSLISLYLVSNPRSGSSVAIQQILTELSFYDVLLLIGTICFVSGISALLTLQLGKQIPKFLVKLDYKTLTFSIISFICAMVFVWTGIIGLIVLSISTSIGLLCAYLEVRRSHCMGVLLIPSILFFAGLSSSILSALGI